MELLKKPHKFEIYHYTNTLTGAVKGLENNYTTIDLRNENFVTGKICYVDGCMNLEMEDVRLYDYKGKEYYFENFFVSGRNIRYVHIPKEIKTCDLLEKSLTGFVPQLPNKGKGKRTFKTSRAVKYNQEIIAENYKQHF